MIVLEVEVRISGRGRLESNAVYLLYPCRLPVSLFDYFFELWISACGNLGEPRCEECLKWISIS